MNKLDNPDFTSYDVQEVTPQNVGQLPANDGFESYGQLWRPVGFIINQRSPFPHLNGNLSLLAMGEDSNYSNLPLEVAPYLAQHDANGHGKLLGQLVSLQHFRTLPPEASGQTIRENYRRILSVMGAVALGPMNNREASFWYGEHPDHPSGRGFFLRALHVGMSDNTGRSSDYYPAESVAYKHFAFAQR
jgi:hypothetical protein